MKKEKKEVRARSVMSDTPFSALQREDDFYRYLFTYSVIQDVPWELAGPDIFVGDHQELKILLESVLAERGKLPVHIPYHAAKWVDDGVVVSFHGFYGDLYNPIRLFCLYERVRPDWRSWSTIANYVRLLRRFFTALGMDSELFRLNYIHEGEVIRYFEEPGFSVIKKWSVSYAVLEFFRFMQANTPTGLIRMDMKVLEDYFGRVNAEYRHYLACRQQPSIPDRVFYEIHFRMLEIMRDVHAGFYRRVMACVVLIFMWSGLRPQDVRKLLYGCVVEREEQGEILYFYEYCCHKPKKHKLFFVLFPAALEAVRVLEGFHRRTRSEYLISFIGGDRSSCVDAEGLEHMYKDFMREEMEQFYRKYQEDYKGNLMDIIKVYQPVFYSYRVHLYTYLIDKGFDNRWIEAHLGHISRYMMGRYYRMKESRMAETRRDIASYLPGFTEDIRELTAEIAAQIPEPPKSVAEMLLDDIDNL